MHNKYIGKPTKWTTKITKEAVNNDILMSVRAPVGPINFATQKICIGRGLASIRTGKLIDKEFLFNFLLKHENEIVGNSGAVFNSINKTQIGAILIPIPPLQEQQRIVEILDKAFVAIDKAKQNSEQNLRNAKEVFESKLHSVFDNTNKKWDETILSNIAVSITDGDHMPPPKTKTGIPFITISNINKEKNTIDFSKTFKVPKKYFTKIAEKRKPRKNDVLYTVTGSYGVPVLIDFNLEFCFQRHIGLIRPKKSINSKWLFYWILSPQAKKQADETSTGTAQKTVSLNALRNFLIPDMPKKEQTQITQQLGDLSTETRKLETIYQQKIEDLDELKKSILQKAFTGKL